MKVENAQVFELTGGFSKRDIFISGERFSAATTTGDTLDATGCYAIPGLIDIHLHGCLRHDFSTAQPTEMVTMAEYLAVNGVTAICPATMTLPERVLEQACRNMSGCHSQNGSELVGINLEGPFVSHQKPGAQNPAYIVKPDAALFNRLQTAAGGKVKLLAIAPETEGALELIRELSAGVVCSLAHTAAGYDNAIGAFAAGARQVTHLYNAMLPFSHREPGVIGAAFDTPECMVELICDNVHIHPSVVRATFKMFGDDRVILISDSMMATGLVDGLYELGGQPVEVVGNVAQLAPGGAIAGSVTNLISCMRTAVKDMGIPLYSAVKCASVNPAKAIGVFADRGSISAGKYADMVLLDSSLSIKQVFLRGRPLLSTK